MNGAIDSQNEMWANTLAEKTAKMDAAIQAARDTVAQALAEKLGSFDAEEAEIRWAITSIYNYDYQHALNEALTAKRAALDAECDSKQGVLDATIAEVQSIWDSCVVSEQASLDANTDAAVAHCDDVKQAEQEVFYAFKEAQVEQFAAWAANERAELAEFIADCEEAWQWIQVSYCLKHGDEGIVDAGHGCSFGQGSGYGNGGYLKGVEVE